MASEFGVFDPNTAASLISSPQMFEDLDYVGTHIERRKKKREQKWVNRFILRSTLSPLCLACPSPLVSVSWDWVRRVRFDHWCSSAYGKEPGDGVPSDHLYLPQRLFLLLATPHPPKSGLPQSLGQRLPWFGFGSGEGGIMWLPPFLQARVFPTAIGLFPGSSSVTLKALQGVLETHFLCFCSNSVS